MLKFYKIAGLNVAMDSFGVTDSRAEKYRICPVEDIHINVKSRWFEVKDMHPGLTDDMGEYLSTCGSFFSQLLRFNGLYMHSSAVVVDDMAYLFTADSGTGKSTHTSLWLELFGEKAFIINDDKPALRLEDGKWYVYGTPWSGKHDISEDSRVPLAGIACLERGEVNSIEPFYGTDAIKSLIKQTIRPRDAELGAIMLGLLDQLMTQVPIWKLRCNMDPDAARVSYETMSGNKLEAN